MSILPHIPPDIPPRALAVAEAINQTLLLDLTEREILLAADLIGYALIDERDRNVGASASHAPLGIGGGGRRPKFYPDIEVREHLIRLHRETTLAQARASCIDRFGPDRCPSQSAIGRFWLQLDTARRRR